jgi:hypothetical protein
MEIVECHSGFAYADRPAALTWQGIRLEVDAVLARGRTPQGTFFQVRAQNGRVFRLEYAEADDVWKIQPY